MFWPTGKGKVRVCTALYFFINPYIQFIDGLKSTISSLSAICSASFLESSEFYQGH
jgi:hypothetical protein